MSVKYLSDFQKPMSIFLLFSILFVFSCSNDNSITKSATNDQLNKPMDFFSDDDDSIEIPEDYWEKINLGGFIFQALHIRFTTGISDNDKKRFPLLGCLLDGLIGATESSKNIDINSGYEFRDKYLLKSEKGEIYTLSYYLISHYALENNLLMHYPLEHISIMETGINVSKELQYGANSNKILITKSTYDDIKNLTKIYRNSENHKEIEPVLDYLEADLDKYYNKPKADIAADFGF